MPDLAAERAFFALERMSAAVRSNVLADGAIAARFGIAVHSPVRIGDRTVKRPDLFCAFSRGSRRYRSRATARCGRRSHRREHFRGRHW